jgi:hypothetical protein
MLAEIPPTDPIDECSFVNILESIDETLCAGQSRSRQPGRTAARWSWTLASLVAIVLALTRTP